MTKRQKIIHALMVLEMLSLNNDGDVCATHEVLNIGGEEIFSDSEYGKILTKLGFHYHREGWYCYT